MPASQPQVDSEVNLRGVVTINRRFHAGVVTDPPRYSSAGVVIAASLKAMGRSQAWLADQLGISKNAVSKWMKDGQIGRANAVRVAAILRISLDQLLRDSGSPQAQQDVNEAVNMVVVALFGRLTDDQREQFLNDLRLTVSQNEKLYLDLHKKFSAGDPLESDRP